MFKLGGFIVLFLGAWVQTSLAAATKYVTEADFAQALKSEFVEQVSDEDVDWEFFGGQTNFAFENVSQVKIMISKAKFDELQNKFSAEAEVFADGKPMAKTQLQGKYYVLGEVLVPARNINKGEVLTQDMLKTITVRMNRIKPVNVVEADALIGREAKRTLREGKIINDKDIGKVILVHKGDIVSSIYRTAKMQISAKVEALEEGGKGDKIEVRNINSKKVLFAEVVDADTVVVEMQ